MKKTIVLLAIVIILVCLNWFQELVAQDISGLSEDDKDALIEQFSTKPIKPGKKDSYQSPSFDLDTTPLIKVPDSLETQMGDSLDDTSSTKQPELTPFEKLLPFGTTLFGGPRETVPPDDIATASDYILGPGDKLIVSLWGQVEKEYSLTVDREGRIFVPQIGKMIVWGKPLADFESQMAQKLSDIYSDFSLSVSLGKIRSIRIYLTGEIKRPGAYTVSSLTSVFNALYLASGPNANGSMRQIRVMRGGDKVAEVDLYRFLLEGDNSSDIRLESGDAIFVPVAGPRVAIRGKIRRPAIYELNGEQDASQLLELAGQPTADAYLSRVMLERISRADEWKVLDLNLDPDRPDSLVAPGLEDGDRLTLFSIFEMKHNMVAAFGLVKHPGYYERNDSTRVSDLIERAALQPYDVHFKRANLFRRHNDWRQEVIGVDLGKILTGSVADNIPLQDGDSLHVYSIADVSWDRYVYIDGQVKKPGNYKYYDKMSVGDLVFLAGSYLQGASLHKAEIARFDSLGEVTLQVVNLNEESGKDIILHDDDRVYIRQLPQWQLHRTVYLTGEIMYPGEYVLSGREETLYDIILRAGGLKPSAFPKGTILERPTIGQTLTRKQIPALLERSSPVVQDSLGNISRQVLFEFEPGSMNRIVLEVDKLLETRGGCCDITLQPGDRIFIPARPSGISVLGAVGSSGTIKFQPDQKTKFYVKRAGDFTSQADKGGMRLIRANGEVYSGSGTINQHVELGDIVVVPTKIHKDKNFMKSFTTTISAVAGVLTTILLIDRL